MICTRLAALGLATVILELSILYLAAEAVNNKVELRRDEKRREEWRRTMRETIGRVDAMLKEARSDTASP